MKTSPPHLQYTPRPPGGRLRKQLRGARATHLQGLMDYHLLENISVYIRQGIIGDIHGVIGDI